MPANFVPSSKRHPCPICGRTKDGDCRSSEADNLVLCHSHTTAEEPINGYRFLHASKDGLWGVWIWGEDKGRKMPRKRPSRERYTYTDRQGNNLIQVVRVTSEGRKDFYQHRWDGAGWVKGLNEYSKANVPIYRFAEVQQAIAQNKTIFMVEGEAKCDALWNLGIPATTTLGGSKKYRAYGRYFEDLQGANLVLCPDRDKTGLEHMEDVARDFPKAKWCYVFPASPLWKHLPANGGLDVEDWIADGATVAEILEAVGDKRGQGQPATVMQAEEGDKTPRLVKEFYLLKEALGDRLRLNVLTQNIELDGNPVQMDRVKLDLAVHHGVYLKSGREDVHDIVCLLAEENQYSPVVEYLSGCYAKYGNDQTILQDIAQRYFGQSNPIYTTFVIRTLIGAVARAMSPGCKMDTSLILQGGQGFLKSSWFKTLAGSEWFDDSLGAISDKDERLKLHRSWFVEWAELETIFSRKDVSATKAFLSCATDHVRPPYGRSIQSLQRHSVIVGTTNRDEFLSDATGNRRFWVIPVAKKIDIAMLKAERDRIWGAAVALYKAGEQWYLTPGEEMLANEIAQQYQTRDPWLDLIKAHVEGLRSVTTKELLNNVLKIEPGRQDRGQLMRVADCLRELGWQREIGFHQGKRQRVWTLPDPPDPPQTEVDRKVDHASNSNGVSVTQHRDPPDPPLDQHLPKIQNGKGNGQNQPTFTQFSEIGGSGGSGGSDLDKSVVLADPPTDPPQTGGSLKIGLRVKTKLGDGLVQQIEPDAVRVEGRTFYAWFKPHELEEVGNDPPT